MVCRTLEHTGGREGGRTHFVDPMNFWPSERLNWGLFLRHSRRRLPRKLERSDAASVCVCAERRSFTTGASSVDCSGSK